MPRRLVQLFAGLVLYGVSSSMLLLAGLGVDPWDVLHQGLARRTGIPTGTWAIIAGAAVLLLWIPLAGWLLGGTVGGVLVLDAEGPADVLAVHDRLAQPGLCRARRVLHRGHHRLEVGQSIGARGTQVRGDALLLDLVEAEPGADHLAEERRRRQLGGRGHVGQHVADRPVGAQRGPGPVLGAQVP